MLRPLCSPFSSVLLCVPQVDLRLSNERYLRDHPEVRVLTMKFMHSVLEEQPDNIVGFASKFFGGDLRAMVESDDSSSSSSSKK